MAAALQATETHILEGRALARAWLPGRFQRVSPLYKENEEEKKERGKNGEEKRYYPCARGWPPMLLDGAHNAHGMAALGHSLARCRIAPAAVVFTCLADKNPLSLLPHVRALATGPIFVPPIADHPRSIPPEELAALIGLNAIPARSLREALTAASIHIASRLPEAFREQKSRNPLLICGSLYLLAQLYDLRRDCLMPDPFPNGTKTP
jgi:dihydrofolate synthase/folylpolyglutamate synthase